MDKKLEICGPEPKYVYTSDELIINFFTLGVYTINKESKFRKTFSEYHKCVKGVYDLEVNKIESKAHNFIAKQ